MDRILIARPRLHSMQRGKNQFLPAKTIFAGAVFFVEKPFFSIQRQKLANPAGSYRKSSTYFFYAMAKQLDLAQLNVRCKSQLTKNTI